MTTDLSEFHESFFEESFEAVEAMESDLLGLDQDTPDMEQINGIFRGAHSIKGGAGMFGFVAISGFTHVMETLLDEIRNNRCPVDAGVIDLLLKAVDCLRDMLAASQAGQEPDGERILGIQQELEAILTKPPADTAISSVASPAPSSPAGGGDIAQGGWQIRFEPAADFFRNGNDPIVFIEELSRMGETRVLCHVDDLPALDELIPDQCHLAWTIELRTDHDREEITEIFSWIEDQASIEIDPLAPEEPIPEATDGENRPPSGSVETTTLKVEEKAKPDRAAPRGSVEDRRPEPGPAPARGSRPADGEKTGPRPQSGSIRVATEKVDSLINLVGELVITQSMLSHLGEDFDASQLEALRNGLANLDRHTRELQESVMSIRMLPIRFCFSRFPRLVHDLSSKLGKNVELELRGEQTELDKTVLEKINDPLVHAVRNCIDHGIEMPEVRRAAGKPETGHICLHAYHSGGNIIIEVIDDGAGLPRQKILARAIQRGLIAEDACLTDDEIDNLIFLPGFSTAEQVSDISGRGVGMDVVRRNITDLGGSVDIRSVEGRGSTLTIRLPLTMAILDGQLVRVGDQIYVIAVPSIIESLRIESSRYATVAGENEVYHLRDSYIPILRLHEALDIPRVNPCLENGILVVVEADGKKVGLFADELLGQQQIVIKSLEPNYRQLPGISGATILGDGRVALIIDIPGLTIDVRDPGTNNRGETRAA